MTTNAPTTTTTSDSSGDGVSDQISAAHDWFMEFIQSRQSVFIPILVIIGIALLAHIIVGWVLRRQASRMNREGFQWTGVIASSLSAPAGLIIWALALTMVARMLIVPDPTKPETAILTTRIAQVRLGLVLALLGWFIVGSIEGVVSAFELPS